MSGKAASGIVPWGYELRIKQLQEDYQAALTEICKRYVPLIAEAKSNDEAETLKRREQQELEALKARYDKDVKDAQYCLY